MKSLWIALQVVFALAATSFAQNFQSDDFQSGQFPSSQQFISNSPTQRFQPQGQFEQSTFAPQTTQDNFFDQRETFRTQDFRKSVVDANRFANGRPRVRKPQQSLFADQTLPQSNFPTPPTVQVQARPQSSNGFQQVRSQTPVRVFDQQGTRHHLRRPQKQFEQQQQQHVFKQPKQPARQQFDQQQFQPVQQTFGQQQDNFQLPQQTFAPQQSFSPPPSQETFVSPPPPPPPPPKQSFAPPASQQSFAPPAPQQSFPQTQQPSVSTRRPVSQGQGQQRTRPEYDDQLFKHQAENAKYSFSTSVTDQINDNEQTREEIRDGLNLKGMYSYSDGFFKRTVHYEADENGYRVLNEDVEPIGDGPQGDPNGRADISSNIGGNSVHYSVTNADFQTRPLQQLHQQQQQPF